MRSLALLALALLLGAYRRLAPNSLADLRQPSSTIPGCVNDWGPLGTGSGVAEPTCEAKAALAEWNEHAAAINPARDTLARAANSARQGGHRTSSSTPRRRAPPPPMRWLGSTTRRHRPRTSTPRCWPGCGPGSSNRKLPIPATIGDGFRTLAAAFGKARSAAPAPHRDLRGQK